MKSHFFAYIARMRYITRWALMRNTFSENVQEHSHMVAVLAHALAVIRNRVYGGQIDAGQVAAVAHYHDASEIITGDMPTPVKYHSHTMRQEFRQVESLACEKLLSMLPEDMKPYYEDCFFPRQEDEYLWRIVKAADKISALIKCIEEQNAGNREFDAALESTKEAVRKLSLPEADAFVDEFIPSFFLSLDEQNQ